MGESNNSEIVKKSIALLDRFEADIHTIPQLLYMNLQNFGSRPANMFYENGVWQLITYSDMVTRLENIALGLMELGIDYGDLVAINAENSVRWIWADTGSMFAGAATVSIYPMQPIEETLEIYNNSRFKLLFIDTEIRLEQISALWHEMKKLQYVIVFQPGFKGDGQKIWGLDELMELGVSLRGQRISDLRQRVDMLKGDDPCTMVYTSGTTGKLKGVMHTHNGLLYCPIRGLKHLALYGRPFDCNMVSMLTLPVSHIMEKCYGVYVPLAVGACIAIARSPALLLEDIQLVRPTMVTLVPRMLSRIMISFKQAIYSAQDGVALWAKAVEVAKRATYVMEARGNGYINMTIPIADQLDGKLREEYIAMHDAVYWMLHHALGGRLRDMNCGGAYLDLETQRIFTGMGIYINCGYGLTETGAGVASSCANAYKIGWLSPAHPTCEFKLEDDGELLVKGPGIITSYYNDSKADEEGFSGEWLRTGDLVEVDERGYIRIIDRKKAIIVLDSGKNIVRSKIETLFTNSELIDQALIIGNERDYITALIVPDFTRVLNKLSEQEILFDENSMEYGFVQGERVCIKVSEPIINHPMVQKLMLDEIEHQINEKLEPYERIRKYKLLNERFMEANGDVTHSQKIKTRIVMDRLNNEIEELY